MRVAKWLCSNSIISSAFISSHSATRKSFLLFLFVYFLLIWTHGFLFYPVGYNLVLKLFILLLKSFQIWQWKPLKLASVFLWHSSISLWIFPYFLVQCIPGSKCLCPYIRISHFSKELWFLLLKNSVLETKIWICVTGISLLPGPINGADIFLELENICIYIHVYIHTHTHLYFYIICLSI